MAEFNYEHITELGHARNRMNAEIQRHIEAGTLTPEIVGELRSRYYAEVRDLDVPAHTKDAVEITVHLLGDCTEEDIRVYLALGNMPEAEEQERRLREAREKIYGRTE